MSSLANEPILDITNSHISDQSLESTVFPFWEDVQVLSMVPAVRQQGHVKANVLTVLQVEPAVVIPPSYNLTMFQLGTSTFNLLLVAPFSRSR